MTRTIQHAGDGNEISFVPIGQFASKGVAVIDTEDLLMLEELGLSLAWNRNSRTGYVFAPAARAVGRSVQVARVLLDCGPGENVRYLNGDPTDLRRSNLSVNPEGNATRRDRDFLTPKAERRAWGPKAQHEYL
ncbi:hypothetical protein [Devosia sp. A449]